MLEQLSFFTRLTGGRSRKKSPVQKKDSPETVYFEGHSVLVHRRRYQRSMNLLIRPNGQLKVTAGRTVPRSVIEKFVGKNRKWIEQNLQHFEHLRRQYPKKNYQSGEEFLLFGQRCTLHFEQSLHSRSYVDGIANRLIVYSKIEPAETTPANETRQLMRKFYEKQGREFLHRCIHEQSRRMQLFPKKVSYRSMKTRWGSCNSHGNISLNWRLAVFPKEVAEYVVIHELAHLQYQNHSKAFWNLVSQYCPQYEVYKNYLRDHHMEVDFLDKSTELFA